MYLQTLLELTHMTDHVKFEWMMIDLLSSYKYKGIEPQSPGMSDRGKDAVYYDESLSVVFAFSIQKRWRAKFNRDFASAVRNNLRFKTFVFCSNQLMSPTARDEIKAEKITKGIEVDFYDAGRIKGLLDNHYKKIRQIYLGIQDNTTIRRKITNTLFDADNEVEMPAHWTMFAIAAPADMIGLFTLTKDEDLTLVCETEEELTAFNTLLNTLMHYRKLATVIDNYIFDAIASKHLVNMPSYYQKVLEYCNLRLRGVDKRPVEVRVTTAGYLGPVNEYCEKIYERLQEDQELKALLDKLGVIHQACMKVRDDILVLPGFQFEN